MMDGVFGQVFEVFFHMKSHAEFEEQVMI